MGEDEKPVTPEDIYIDLREGNQDDITVILEKNKRAWSWKLGDINVTEMRFDLVSDTKLLKSAPFYAGRKSRELVEID